MRPIEEVGLQAFSVETPDGWSLGVVEQSRDGRWIARPRGMAQGIGVFDRPAEANDAVVEHAQLRVRPRHTERVS